MDTSNNIPSFLSTGKIVDLIIRLILLYGLISWCFAIIQPFILVLAWGAIIAIAVYPVYARLVTWSRGRKIASAAVVALFMMSLIIIPGWLITESAMSGVMHIRESYLAGQPIIPPPGATVQYWPSVAKPIVNLWQLASDNLQEAVMQHQEQFTKAGSWLFAAISGLGKGIIQFMISIILASVFLVFSETIRTSALKTLNKIAPAYAETFMTLTTETVKTVVKGVLGVAAIQAVMAGIAFYIVGIPYAGVWTILCLMLSMVQIGSWPVLIPMAIYMFSTHDLLSASLFAGWMVVVVLTDNILTPVFMGRGSSVPMLVIFVGTIGGFMVIGFLGLFVGAVTLSISYQLIDAWLNSETPQ